LELSARVGRPSPQGAFDAGAALRDQPLERGRVILVRPTQGPIDGGLRHRPAREQPDRDLLPGVEVQTDLGAWQVFDVNDGVFSERVMA